MKKSIVAVIGVGVLAGVALYANRSKPELESRDAATQEAIPTLENVPATAAQPVAASAEAPVQTLENPSATTATTSQPAGLTPDPNPDPTFVQRTADWLVSRQTSHQQRREIWKQLRENGKLDSVIAELEQRTSNNPAAAEYPTALGQAYLQKCATTQDARDKGILAMQADKMFDSALSLDPSNWEARFTKAVAMSYWPPVLNKGDEVIQHFQTLIEQQEAQMPQPQFSEPYAWLGDQYQKAGRTDDARAVWQRGTALFPGDQKLQEKLAGAAQ